MDLGGSVAINLGEFVQLAGPRVDSDRYQVSTFI
jgi:hypothetical protein